MDTPPLLAWPEINALAKSFQPLQVFFTGYGLGVFDALAGESLPAAAVAARIGASPRGCVILLDALASLGLLVKEGETYRNTPAGRLHLHREGGEHRGMTLEHTARLWDAWRQLPEAVRTGTSVHAPGESLTAQPERNRSFIGAMAEIGQTWAGVIADNLDLSGCRRLLDLGGGPGTYAAALLRRHPAMTAVVADLPLTLESARPHIEATGLGERLETRAVDFYQDPEPDLGTGYDLTLISNVLHVEGPAENRRLLARVFRAMVPGGILLIHEAIIDDNRITPLDRALFAVNMLVNTERGNCYTMADMKAWLEEAGFADVALVPCFPSPSLIKAVKPGHGR